MSKDFYDVLEISKNASADQIKRAYRKLAMQHHPDRNSNDQTAEKKLKKINEAYEVLKDSQKKTAYDQYGHSAFKQGYEAQERAGSNFNNANFSDIFGNVFDNFMGGNAQAHQQNAQRGANLQCETVISMAEAFQGVTKTINIRAATTCKQCSGSGASSKSDIITCSKCHGSGNQRVQQGFFTMEHACHVCQGTGQIIKNPCTACYGQGRLTKDRNVDINIPAGIEDSTKIRISKQGEAGLNGAYAGDLYVFIYINPHEFFEREGQDLLFKASIPMSLAILGGEIAVPTIEGTETHIKIPKGIQSHTKLRLRNKGMTILRQESRGDMYVLVVAETPINLTKKQLQLIEQFDSISQTSDNNPQSSSFSKKIKSFLQSF